jgi:hypothetical protein
MQVQERLTQIKDQKSYSSPAKRIMDHLKPLLSKSSDMKKRWMWELIQNATDLGDSIKMKIEVFEDKLVFSHTGKPFSLSEAFDLIMPDSSKDENREIKKSIIGQFGTGFLSTHILSRLIQVSGIVEENGERFNFQFTLDRTERGNKNFLIESIKTAENQFRTNLRLQRAPSRSEYQTHFTYFINETYESIDGHEVVNEGLKTLDELMPFVHTFRTQIEELQVIDHRKNTSPISYRREDLKCEIENLYLINTIVTQAGKPNKEVLIGNILTEDAEIAFPLKRIQDNKYSLLPYPKNCPKLFCAFPMIGTQEFSLPFVIHSENFDPNRERDGISISGHDPINRNILIQSKDAYLQLLAIIQDHQWKNAYHVCGLKTSGISDPESKKWFDSVIGNPLKEGIRDYGLIELDESLNPEALDFLGNLYIPFVEKSNKSKSQVLEEIFNIAFTLLRDSIPGKSTYKNWYNTLDFSLFPWEKLDLQKLAEIVEPKKKTIAEVAQERSITEEEVIEAFQKLTALIVQQDAAELLDKHTLICTKSLKITKLKGLKLDRIKAKGVTKKQVDLLKDVYWYLTNSDIDDTLIHKDFESIPDIWDEEEAVVFDKFVSDIDNHLRDFEGNFKDENFLLTLKNLFSWYSTSGIDEARLTKLMPYFTANKSQLYLNTKTSEELEYAFDIEISGKSKALAALAKSNLSSEEIEQIAKFGSSLTSLLNWVNERVEDNPNKELGNLGEAYLYDQLCRKFGKERVHWADHSAYDFIVYDRTRKSVQYYVDAKTTGRGMANSDNVPFFMGMEQWKFLDKTEAKDKYLIARVFKNRQEFNVKFLKLSPEPI